MIVNHCVQERRSDLGPIIIAAFTGAVGGAPGVAFALLPTQKSMPTAVGDVGELRDVDVDQRAGIVMFIPAQRFAGDPINVRQPVDSAPGQHGVYGGGRYAELARYLHGPQTLAPP